MKWENLKNESCPYCGNALYENVDRGRMECISCTFHIQKSRMRMITEHRAYPERQMKSIRWQYLKVGKCPVCTGNLYPSEGPHPIMRCVQEDCSFKIGEHNIRRMLQESTHPINRFEVEDDLSPTPPLE